MTLDVVELAEEDSTTGLKRGAGEGEALSNEGDESANSDEELEFNEMLIGVAACGEEEFIEFEATQSKSELEEAELIAETLTEEEAPIEADE